MKKKIVIMGMAVLLLGLPCSACQTLEKEAAEPRRTQSAKSVVQAGIADTEINDRELQQAESEIVDGLELASWGTKVYDPVEHENVGGLAVSVTQVTYYTSLKDAGFSPDVIPLNDDAVKDVDGEDGEMLVAGELLDEDGNMVIGDEMLTPDSSRFWPLEGYEQGKPQPSFDKQFVRDWLKANPDSDYLLPEEVIKKTVDKYKEAYELLTGKEFQA